MRCEIKTLKDIHSVDLDKTVNKYLADGWKLHGVMHVSNVYGVSVDDHMHDGNGFFRLYTQVVRRSVVALDSDERPSVS